MISIYAKPNLVGQIFPQMQCLWKPDSVELYISSKMLVSQHAARETAKFNDKRFIVELLGENARDCDFYFWKLRLTCVTGRNIRNRNKY